MRDEQTEVLVVGAGPVGLLTGLLLAEAGIQVKIIDRGERTAARSYACALHPRTLKLLERLELAPKVLELGRRIGAMAFYDGDSRRGEISLAVPGGDFPFLLILPQDAFEDALELELRREWGVVVDWNHRFEAVEEKFDGVDVAVEKLGGTATGYIVPHWETVVRKRLQVHARFLLGADGQNSMVRQRLGIEHEQIAGRQFFAAYEFEPDGKIDDELRVVLDKTTTNVLWPLPGNKCRWTFQVLKSETPADFPEKVRRPGRVSEKTVDENIRQYVEQVAKQRAPWFSAGVKELAWCTEVFFEHRLAKRYGQGRCWLVGDAAHQTGPVGAQSMNVGCFEAEDLVMKLKKILRENAPLNSLEAYNRSWRSEWQSLLGTSGGLKAGNDATPWARDNSARILPCLPASGAALAGLAGQLGLQVVQNELSRAAGV